MHQLPQARELMHPGFLERKSEAKIEGAKGFVFSRRGIDAVVDPNRTYGQIVAQSEADPGTEIIERRVP
jgi:hypothetical protein